MLRRMREWSRPFLYLDLVFTLAWYVVTGTVALLLLIVVVIRGEYDRAPTLLATTVGSVAFLSFATWIARDARRASKALREQRKKERLRADGDVRS